MRSKNAAQHSIQPKSSYNIGCNHGGEKQGNHEVVESTENVDSSTEKGQIVELEKPVEEE